MTAPLRLEFDVPCSPHRAFGLWISRTDLRWPSAHCASAQLINRWHLCSDPADATEVEVPFLASAPGRTRVPLEHRAWDALEDGAVRRDRNQAGWQQVLHPDTAAASAEGPSDHIPHAAAAPSSGQQPATPVGPSVRDPAGHSPDHLPGCLDAVRQRTARSEQVILHLAGSIPHPRGRVR